MDRNPNLRWLPLAFALTAAIGMFFGHKISETMSTDNLIEVSDADDLRIIDDVQDIIYNNYYGPLDTATYIATVIQSMTNQLDVYSNYFDMTDSRGFHQVVNGTYKGIGLDFLIVEDSIHITKVLANSPSETADLKRGDIISEVFNDPVDSLSADDLNRLVKDFDSIDLTVYRTLTNETFERTLIKSEVTVMPLRSKILEDGSVCYISIPRFSDDIFLEFMDELDYYKNQGIEIKKLIIDLRNNPGGLLDETVKILNQLIREPNKTIVSTVDSKGKVKDYKSNGRSFLNIENIVVLINGISASASEIFAGSLQDHELATIVGEASYGKGKIQQQYKLSSGSSLNLTIGEYILPSGKKIKRSIDSEKGQGIEPDIRMNNDCSDSRSNRYSQEYAYLISKNLLGKETLGIDQMISITNSYKNQSNSDTSCQIEYANRMATLLWLEYQSDLDLSKDILEYDQTLKTALEQLN